LRAELWERRDDAVNKIRRLMPDVAMAFLRQDGAVSLCLPD